MNIWKFKQANTVIHVKMFRYIYQYLYFFVQGEFMYKLCIKFLGENSDLKKKFLNIVENKESIPTYIECKVQY